MKLTKSSKVVCICRGGQVRSVAARFILADRHGLRKVLACGWEKNDPETVAMLCEWADAVLVVGSASDWNLPTAKDKTVLLDIGPDRWGHYGNGELVGVLTPLIERLVSH